MGSLATEQKRIALEVMQECLNAPQNEDGAQQWEIQLERDKKRIELISEVLGPLVKNYLDGNLSLPEFKSEIDSINKRNELWGFKGIKGQMFFNMIVNLAENANEVDSELKAAILIPNNEDMSKSRIRNFYSYVRRLGDDHVNAGGSARGKPKTSSIPYFLSYFWQIQDHQKWPIYYTNSVNIMIDLNLWQETDDMSNDYISFKHVHEELIQLFNNESKQHFGMYEVEHVFWFKGGNPFGGDKPVATKPQKDKVSNTVEPTIHRLPDSYVPPIIKIIPRLARNDESLIDIAKASGTSLPRALEKNVDAAFTILGYETKLLGQGQGRVPDGLAQDQDNSYAIIWDSKARADSYSMGTDDRTIREYVVSQSRELKRKRSIRNIYYVIISSKFADDYDDSIRTLKMDTDVNEVILMESDALVAMVDSKLRDPFHVSLGPDGLQRLFTVSGILNSDNVREMIV